MENLATSIGVKTDMPEVGWNPTNHPAYGTCEKHGEYATGLFCYSRASGVTYMCGACAAEENAALAPPFRYNAAILDIATVQQSGLRRILSGFKRLKTLFEHTIGNVFMVSDNSGLPASFHNKINIVVELQQFTSLAYFVWAKRENSTIVNLWNSQPDIRGKFWSLAVLRLIIELAVIDSNSSNVCVWIMAYGRACPIKCYTTTPFDIVTLPNGTPLYRLVDYRVNPRD